MTVNNSFSLGRFMMIFKQSLRINKKMVSLSIAGVAGTTFVVLLLLQSFSGFRNWHQEEYLITFIVLFILLGTVYAGLSFPAFRSKERSVEYLMLPASTLEKFGFEFITRIVTFIFVMPVIFWIAANLEATIVHNYKPSLPDSSFSFSQGWIDITNNIKINGWKKFQIFQGGLFLLIAAFSGATHFSKSPLIKTLFSISIIFAALALYTYFLFKGLDIENLDPVNERVLFIHNERQAVAFFSISTLVVNISLIAISWFRLKEKEA